MTSPARRPLHQTPAIALRWLLGYTGVPYLARPTFRYDLIATVLATVGLGVIIPEFSQLFVLNTLRGPDWLLPLVLAELAVGNFTGSLLAQVLQRRRRVPFMAAARAGIAACLLLVALLPPRPGSAYAFAAIMMGPALLLAVDLNLRSSIVHSNYPAPVRGRIFSRHLVFMTLCTVTSVKLAGYALDHWPGAYHMLYPLAAGCFLASALAVRRIRVRHERRMLAEGRGQPFHPLEGFRLLRRDRTYGRFMMWQMFSGGMVLMTASVLTLTLKDVFGVGYAEGTTALVLLPFGVQLASTPLAGRLFDGVGPNRFRAISATFWVASRLVIFVGAVQASWALVLAGFAVMGLGRSTGAFAFNIGHTRFAPPGQSQLYMGIHMTLQGVRGLTLPFVGVWLYKQPWMGLGVLALAAGVQLLAAGGFFLSPEPRTPED